MITALANGLTGMDAMQSQVGRHSASIAQQSTFASSDADPSSRVSLSGEAEAGDLENSLVGMKESVLLYKANANTVRAADEMLGTLLDIKA